MRVMVIAPSRYAIREPHAGGLERVVWERVHALRRMGHQVLFVGSEGSDFLDMSRPERTLPPLVWPAHSVPSDATYPPGFVDGIERRLVAAIRRAWDSGEIDVVDNHSLHPAVITATATLGVPTLTTFHTPPLPELVAAAINAPTHCQFVSISEHTTAEWNRAGVRARLLANAVDGTQWALGEGGPGWVWFGRLVPEKGAHIAIDAARFAGRHLTIAGHIGDNHYFDTRIRPLLGSDVAYKGALSHENLCSLVGRSAVALVTPMWDEPFGLVAVEALLTGTPVAAFDRGGIPEATGTSPGVALISTHDSTALAAAALRLENAGKQPDRRAAIRQHALDRRSFHHHLSQIDAELTAVTRITGASS